MSFIIYGLRKAGFNGRVAVMSYSPAVTRVLFEIKGAANEL